MNLSRMRLCALLFLLLPSPVIHADSRQKIEFPDMMREHMLANMRDHLLAMTEIQAALGRADYDKAADVAEQRIGMSSMGSHGAAHMAPLMPPAMQEIGTAMHRTASQFARVAQEAAVDNDAKRAIAALSQVSAQCVACHTAYRLH